MRQVVEEAIGQHGIEDIRAGDGFEPLALHGDAIAQACLAHALLSQPDHGR